jgi:hypothetical protein
MKTPLASPPEDLAESAAGEEDPGSAIDLAIPNGEGSCPQCDGIGTLAGLECSMCHGTGKVTPGAGVP